jgi:flagellar hook-associated protein 2
MATVGLSFGSAASGTGFDVSSTVSSLIAIASAVETPWKAQIATLQAQDAALSSLGTNLSALSTAVGSLTNFDGVLSAKQGSSSNPGVLFLDSASSSAVAGSHTVVVTSLAATSSKYSDRITNAHDVLSGSLTFQEGSGPSRTFTVDSSSNTLATLAQAINAGFYGVTASIVTDTQGSRLSLVSAVGGAAGEISLASSLHDDTTSAAVAFTTGQTGADAQLRVDGLDTTSASNTVTGAIPGVTFQLLAAAPGTSLQVQITNDNTAIVSAMQSLVTAYNATAATIKAQEGKDGNGKAEPLFGDPTLALLQSQLSSALFGGVASGAVGSITQLGLTLDVDGKLTLDAGELNVALNSHFTDVTGFFQNVGSFGQNLSTSLNSLGSVSIKGAIYLALQQNTTQEKGLTANITSEESRMADYKVRLTAQLNLANQILQSIPSQLNQVNEIYSALSGYSNGPAQ